MTTVSLISEEQLPNIHPGEIIREDFLTDLEMTPADLAKALGLPPSYVEKILNGVTPINENIAGRLSRVLGCSQQYWLNLQAAYNREESAK